MYQPYLLNAFSLNMLEINQPLKIRIVPLSLGEVKEKLKNGFVSAVGHQETANILTEMLGMQVECNRVTVKLKPLDDAVVAQYIGPRLPEGATKLPEGAEIRFFLVQV